MATLPARARDEAAALTALGARLVVSDIPALGIAAARKAGLPAVALGNFSWDWAYRAYDGGDDVADAVAEAYRTADLALRLPLWGGFEAFPTVIDIPFIARRSRRTREETRAAFGLPPDERLALVSFGGYGVEGMDLDAIARLEGYRVLVSSQTRFGDAGRLLRDAGPTGSLLPLDEPSIYARGFRYEDLVRAVDVVVTKPGYGIIAECAANDTAMLYTSRGKFVEYDVLVAGLSRYLRAGFIDQAALFSGEWQRPLDALLAQPRPPERPGVDGADVAAELILEFL
jgi:L-arabinokinase